MRNYKQSTLFPFFYFCSFFSLFGQQDLGGVLDRVANRQLQPFTISGGLHLTTNFYQSSGISPRRDQFNWLARANLNLQFLGIHAPFSLAFSDGNQQFNLPSYTFTGISPSYKWATLHLGDRHLNYSKYTLNNLNFRGIGFELTPGRFYISAMHGRLRRAVAEDFNSRQSLDPSYKRTGYGAKVGYQSKKGEYQFVLFSAKDDENSIAQPVNRPVRPADNTVISLIGRQQLFENVSMELEWGHSTFNEDTRTNLLPNEDRNFGNNLFGLTNPRFNNLNGNAYKTRLVYNGKDFSTNFAYERIDRGFKSLGALFFLNDVEYLTLGASKSFFENRLAVFFNGGLERTNLDDFEKDGTNRLALNFNSTYRHSDRLQFNASYSNFQNTTKIRTLADPTNVVDSILLAQTTQTSNFVTNYQIGTEERPASLTLVLTYQEANNIVEDAVDPNAQSKFFNNSFLYSTSWPKSHIQFNAGINYNQTNLTDNINRTLALNSGISKSWLEGKLRANLRTSLNRVFFKGNNNNIFNISTGASYNFKSGHQLNFNATILNRSGDNQFTEFYGQLGYGYTFAGRLNQPKGDQGEDLFPIHPNKEETNSNNQSSNANTNSNASENPAQSTPLNEAENPEIISTIQTDGTQSLFDLAIKYYGDGQLHPTLSVANQIDLVETNMIPINTRLIIPNLDSPLTPIYYAYGPYDTLESIAEKFSTTVTTLQNLNAIQTFSWKMEIGNYIRVQ